ncbi:DUF4198 domain-containing protein [Puniceicoccaceae bacterium K14]|nr:DUF4198 domain-containing protein [Puniceicoccaceae bacterium K14]
MKRIKKTLLTIALPIIGLLSTAEAHRIWMIPSTSTLSGEDQWISVEAAISNDLFFPNHYPVPLKFVKATSPSGKELELRSTAEGKIRSSFEVLLEEKGSYRIAYENKMLFVSWKENGEYKRFRGTREQAEEKELKGKEALKFGEYFTRVETIVTSGTPSDLKLKGTGVEFSFETHPNDLYFGETARFQVLLDGEPQAECTVTVIKGNDRFRDSVDEIEVKSDSEGFIEINWPSAGRYWIEAYIETEPGEFLGKPVTCGSDYVLTVEVLPE